MNSLRPFGVDPPVDASSETIATCRGTYRVLAVRATEPLHRRGRSARRRGFGRTDDRQQGCAREGAYLRVRVDSGVHGAGVSPVLHTHGEASYPTSNPSIA